MENPYNVGESFKQLQMLFRNMGWYSGTLTLKMELKSAFEGFTGRASETWESRVFFSVEKSNIHKDESEMILSLLECKASGYSVEEAARNMLAVINSKTKPKGQDHG